MTEVELCQHVSAHLKSMGYEVYEEVAIAGAGIVDLVAKRGPKTWAVHGKLRIGEAVVNQAVKTLGRTHMTSVATLAPKSPRKIVPIPPKVGWIGVDESGEVRPIIDPLAFPPDPSMAVTDELKDQQRSGRYARAGSPGGGHYTPSKDTNAAIVEMVRVHQGTYLKDLLRRLEVEGITERQARPRLLGKGMISGLYRKGIGTNARFWTEDEAP